MSAHHEHEHTLHYDPDSGIVGTTQSLIVAFVLAMTFRGFVAEGFVIPTGSMAPTLLGEHHLMHSQLTGATFPIGVSASGRTHSQEVYNSPGRHVDPMIGPQYLVTSGLRPQREAPRAGDRILVLKGLYSFAEPKRWDVIVFKNPTDPKGEAGNYIKRLVGLPNETVWLADGDVFVRRNGDEEFRIQRKPEHTQRALWQPIHMSDHMLVRPQHLATVYHGPPWFGQDWDTTGRSYRTDTASPTVLMWNSDQRPLDDWTTYNMLLGLRTVPISDLRVSAGVVADQPGLAMTLELEARGHVYEFSVDEESARVRYRSLDDDRWLDEASIRGLRILRPGRVTNVEFWHVDQAISVFVDGRRMAYIEYEWSPEERVDLAAGRDAMPRIEWRFEGSPVTLHRIRMDRDLYYRSGMIGPDQPATGTHPDYLAELGPDHFFMLGDNSQASLDSRSWGNPHPLVARQIDDAPFVVHRKLLLGKAWVVYFPAPFWDGGYRWSPDFGRLRYIR